jgi:membrane-anchored protein YejM (alkaline phosphatase superfamily)
MGNWSDYLWAQLGAMAGAALGLIPAVGLGIVALLPAGVMDAEGGLGEEDWYLFLVSTAAVLLVTAVSAWFCNLVLRKRSIPAARETAVVLAVLVMTVYLAAAYSSTTAYQSDLFPVAAAIAAISPMAARAIVAMKKYRDVQTKRC